MNCRIAVENAAVYPLIDALRHRRSRRFGLGMTLTGPLAHRSTRQGQPLSEEEEAMLAFAACGTTGPALGELDYSAGGGGTIMTGLHGRTVASGDAIHAVSVFVINAGGTYLLKRPQNFAAEELPELAALGREGKFVEAYRRSRVRVGEGRASPSLENFVNLAVNRWSLYDPAATYFLPVNELTLMTINGVLEILAEENGAMLVDERNGFRPAGLARYRKSRGGWLDDDPSAEKTFTIQALESLVTEFVTVEQGMVLQNLALMAQALGLGGFPHWAAHPYGWLQALGFRGRKLPATGYLGMARWMRAAARLLGKDTEVVLAEGLEVDGRRLLAPFCPPWYPTMEAAVRAVVDIKWGADGLYRKGVRHGAFASPESISSAARPPSERTIEATIAFCDHVFTRYGRFPAYQPPFRTVLGYQVNHPDPEFYAAHYRPGALSETQLRHMTST